MAAPKAVWGIDIGKLALKAVKLRVVEGELQVEAFDIIEHPKIITQKDPEAQQLINDALAQFVARNDMAGTVIGLAVPGQTSFTRFVPLPPVEKRKIPDIVRFEAEQQIPFSIRDVVWRWQTFQAPDSPDVEVGIFAMKRADIGQTISHLSQVGLTPNIVQMAPLAMYNFMKFDDQLATDGATLLADVGTDTTNIVISDGSRLWTRTIQIGGNNFTESLVKAFKLSFAKAEKLKRTAATSKYARQIFQAMRPVFAELVQEIQRSVGYYTSLHRETRFKRLIGLGNGFRLPGLQKFLEQTLNMPVVRIDAFNRLQPSEAVSAATFTENVLSFAVGCGLAIQGLELADVNTNLLPEEIAHRRLWAKKKPWFVAAAAAIVLGLAMFPYRAHGNREMLAETSKAKQAQAIVNDQQLLQRELDRAKGPGDEAIAQIKNRMKVFDYRDYWPKALNLLFGSLNAAFSDQDLILNYSRYLSISKDVRNKLSDGAALGAEEIKEVMSIMGAGSPQELAETLKRIRAFELTNHNRRKIAFVERMEVLYFENIKDAAKAVKALEKSTAGPPGASHTTGGGSETGEQGPTARGFAVIMTVRTPLAIGEANDILRILRAECLDRSQSVPEISIEEFVPVAAGAVGSASAPGRETGGTGRGFSSLPRSPAGAGKDSGARMPDPLFAGEDISSDMYFKIGWAITVNDVSPGATPAETPK